jgi:membrane protease YdiL (CAAX protease family)
MLGGMRQSIGTRARPATDAGADAARRATATAWWAWRWRGWAPWRLEPVIVALAALAVLLDLATAWADVSLRWLGGVPISPALPLAGAAAVGIGASALGCTRSGVRAWRELAIVAGALMVIAGAVAIVELGGAGVALGLVVAAVGEELVFRLAVLVVAGALVARLAGRDWRRVESWGTGTVVAALLAGALAFSSLPGHVAQIHGPGSAVPFASLGVLFGWVVLRTGALWPAVVAHALLNFVTLTAARVGAPTSLRLALAAATLIGLVVGADVAGRRTGRLRPVPSVIDLTVV